MDNLAKQASGLKSQVDDAAARIGLDKLIAERDELAAKMEKPDFWQDARTAGDISKKHATLVERISPWENVSNSLNEVLELTQLGDKAMVEETSNLLAACQQDYETLKKELRFSGPFDANDAILSIFAGAGGTDAQDWAAMLSRMYVRWAEAQGLKIHTISDSAGDEAGIKSVTMELDGPMAYGKLKGEHGVHRLVRLSPFNADNLRQTSFAKVELLPKIDQPEVVEIDEKDLKIDVYRAGGHGGQSVNTTDSAVRVTHIPTGISVSIQNERSQLQNKEVAMTILRSKLAQLQLEQHAERLSELKGPNEQAAWGNQIRSYVLHPYKMVKDLRTNVETSDTDSVLDGGIDLFLDSYEPPAS